MRYYYDHFDDTYKNAGTEIDPDTHIIPRDVIESLEEQIDQIGRKIPKCDIQIHEYEDEIVYSYSLTVNHAVDRNEHE